MKLATKIATLLLAVVALVHLLRLFFGWDVLIDGWSFPVWGSLIGFVLPAALAFFMYREHQA